MYKEITKCMACGSVELTSVLDLGNQPLANSYLDDPKVNQPEFPLAINVCRDCWHVQLTHAVDPDFMFRDYAYVSGTSKTMHEHCEWFANYTLETYSLTNAFGAQTILDIGCNDGTQLDKYAEIFNLETIGVDPATNIHRDFTSKNSKHKIYVEYFNSNFVEKNKKEIGIIDIITAQNVFAHNSNPLEFLETAKKFMDDASMLFIQTSQADMILNGEFDTIYHEHMNFFCINSMNTLVERAGMQLLDVIKCPLHGNSFIFVIAKKIDLEGIIPSRKYHIENLLEMEKKSGLHDLQTYFDYAERCHETIASTKHALKSVDDATLLIGYGAAAKGMTFLNALDYPLDFIIDDSSLKQGKFTPGSRIPIVGPDYLDALPEDINIVFVPLAWNFFEEIRHRILTRWPTRRVQFLRYFPEVEWIQK